MVITQDHAGSQEELEHLHQRSQRRDHLQPSLNKRIWRSTPGHQNLNSQLYARISSSMSTTRAINPAIYAKHTFEQFSLNAHEIACSSMPPACHKNFTHVEEQPSHCCLRSELQSHLAAIGLNHTDHAATITDLAVATPSDNVAVAAAAVRHSLSQWDLTNRGQGLRVSLRVDDTAPAY